MKKIVLFLFVAIVALSCDNDGDITSVSDYDFVSFEGDNVNFELDQDGSSTQTVTIYNSKTSSSDRTYNLEVLPAGFSETYDTTVNTDAYNVPATVTIPANESSAQFEVTITDNGVSSGQRLSIAFSDGSAINPHPINLNIIVVCPINELIFDVTFDNYAEETSWELYDITNGSLTLIASGGNYDDLDDQSLQERICIGNGEFNFVIYDAFSDGICCNFGQGSYTLTANGQVVREGGSFGQSESTIFSLP